MYWLRFNYLFQTVFAGFVVGRVESASLTEMKCTLFERW